jgi:hypothetical protein
MDPTTGRFSGKQPAADNIQLGFSGGFAQNIFSGTGTFSATLLGLGLGDSRNNIPATYTYETRSALGVLDTVTIAMAQPLDTANSQILSRPVEAATAEATLAAKFGIPAGFVQNGQITQGLVGYQFVAAHGRGCYIDDLFGGNCTYNGPRWFSGGNETKADPNGGNVAGTGDAKDNNNAGELPGVLTIQHPQSYYQVGAEFRMIEGALGGWWIQSLTSRITSRCRSWLTASVAAGASSIRVTPVRRGPRMHARPRSRSWTMAACSRSTTPVGNRTNLLLLLVEHPTAQLRTA